MTILSPRTASEIIGRQPELAAVEAFLDRPAEGLTALVLEGEAGIGKSTLWLAGVAAARARSFVVLTSRPAETERMLPNVVLGDLFGDLDPTLLDELPLPRRRAFEAALLLGGQPEAPVDPRTVGLAILTLIPLLASGRPVVLAIDDDQWLDLSSDATLRFVLRRLGTQPLRLLLSRRTPPGPAPALEDAIDSSAVERLAIGPLSVGAIQLLLRRGLGVSLSRPNLLRLHEVSAGNPFYALELARTIAVEPARGANEPLIVPASLERLIGTRLDSLAPGTRHPLLLIAAHGRFPAAMLPAVDLSVEALHQAIAGRVLEERGGVIRFSHPLLASTVYQAASAAERRAVHRQLAGIVADDVQRARHIALGADEASEETAAALESAADVARDRGLPLAAAELAEHAARLTPANAFDDRHRRMIAAGLAHLRGGDRASALAIATDLLAASPSGAQRAEALMLRAELEPPGPAIPLLEQALAEATGAAELEAAIHARLTIVGRFVHGGEWAERHGRALLQLAERLDDDVLRTTALVTLALREFDGADPRGLPRAEEAHRFAMSIGDPATLKLSMLALAYIHSWSGRTAQARAWLEHQITEWRDRDEQARAELLWSLGFVDVASGRWSEAEECAREAFEINDAYEPEPGDHLLPALVALHRGQFAVARERALLGLQRPEREFLEDFHAVLGTCEAWTGRPETALDHFAQAERTAEARGWREASLRYWRPDHVETLVQLGRIEEAGWLVDAWEATTVGLDRQRVHAQAMRCRGLTAGAKGDMSTASDLLVQAADREAEVDDPFGRARALLALGIVRRRMRQKNSARAALEAALAAFQELGAASWVATARGELARIGGRRRISSLSESEARVAQLVVEGRTNREIAAALYLSERTVASHLTHVYSKLGLRSRTELAGHAALRKQMSVGGADKVPTF